MEGPVRSFLLKGNLKNAQGNLSLRIPHNDIKFGLWQLTIRSIAFKCNEIINVSITLESNFVSDIRFSITNDIETYNSILNLIPVKGIVNESKVFQFTETWYVINSPNDYLNICFRDVYTNNKVTVDLDVNLFILLKKIR